jgi:phosphoribosyl-ATP pyrophosphohydrolase
MTKAQRAIEILESIAEERARGRKTSRVISIGVLVLFILFGFTLYSRLMNFDSDALMEHLSSQGSTRIWPQISEELDDLAQAAVPAISDAMVEEASNLLPVLGDRLNEESEIFQNQVAETMETSLNSHFLQAAEENDEAMQDRLSLFSTEGEFYDDLMESLNARTQGWAQSHLDSTFERHVALLQEINETTKVLQLEADAQRADGTTATPDDVLLLFVEIMNARLNSEG